MHNENDPISTESSTADSIDKSVMTSSCNKSDSEVQTQTMNDVSDAICQTEPAAPRKPTLSTVCVSNVSIPPKKIFHPAIINATKAIYGKHPSELTLEETEKFNWYLEHKRNCGEPVESDIIYLPSTMRNCLHCDLPT